MVGNDAGVIKDEEFVADRRPAPHHYPEHEREHHYVQDGLEQSPAITQSRIAEPGAGLADDQGVDDALLGSQRVEKAWLRPRLPGLARRALAQHRIVAVDRLEPAVQYLEDRLGIVFVVGRSTNQLSTDGEGLDEPAAVEIDGQLRALCCWVRRIERSGAAEGLGRLFQATEAVEEIRSMQMVFGRFGRDG